MSPSIMSSLTGNAPINLTQSVDQTPGTQFFQNFFSLTADSGNAGADFGVGFEFRQVMNSQDLRGGRVLVDAQLFQTTGSNTKNSNHNWVALQGIVNNSANDGGTNSAPQGAYFGISSAFRCGGTFLLECTGGEINSYALSGSTIKYKALWTLVGGGSTDAVQGETWDTMLAFSDQSGSVGHQSAILIGAMNGQFPVTTTGTLWQVLGAHTIANGIDFSPLTITNNILNSRTMSISGNGYITETGNTLKGDAPPLVFSNTSAGQGLKNARIIMTHGILHFQSADDSLKKFTDAFTITQSNSGPKSHVFYTSDVAGNPRKAFQITNNGAIANVPVILPKYTVSKLPSCNASLQGGMVYVVDLTTVSYNTSPIGGGSHSAPVACDGSSWSIH